MHGGKKPHKKSNSKLNIFSQNSLDNLFGHREESMYKSSNDHTTTTVQTHCLGMSYTHAIL